MVTADIILPYTKDDNNEEDDTPVVLTIECHSIRMVNESKNQHMLYLEYLLYRKLPNDDKLKDKS